MNPIRKKNHPQTSPNPEVTHYARLPEMTHQETHSSERIIIDSAWQIQARNNIRIKTKSEDGSNTYNYLEKGLKER